MMGVGSSDIDDVDIRIFDQLLVGTIGFGGGGTFAGLEELFGARNRRGGCGSGDGVFDIGYLTSRGIKHEIFRKLFGDASSCWSSFSVRWRYGIEGMIKGFCIPRIPQRMVYGDDILIE